MNLDIQTQDIAPAPISGYGDEAALLLQPTDLSSVNNDNPTHTVGGDPFDAPGILGYGDAPLPPADQAGPATLGTSDQVELPAGGHQGGLADLSDLSVTPSGTVYHGDVEIGKIVPETQPADLTPLLQFNQVRDDRVITTRGDRKPKKDRRPAPAPAAAPARAALLRDPRASSALTRAFADRVPAQENEDGVDHINVSDRGATDLGQKLFLNAHTPFVHPAIGRFSSVGGLWFFVLSATQDDEFRHLSGPAVRARGMARNFVRREVEDFKFIIAEATWFKVLASQPLVDAMVKNELPYRSYTKSQGELGLRQALIAADWLVPVYEEIGRTLKARVEHAASLRARQQAGEVIDLAAEQEIMPNFDFLARLEHRNAARPGKPQGKPGARRQPEDGRRAARRDDRRR